MYSSQESLYQYFLSLRLKWLLTKTLIANQKGNVTVIIYMCVYIYIQHKINTVYLALKTYTAQKEMV